MVFWKHGYDATSIAMLTKSMGVGAPSLYAAFGDKRALFDEALGYYAKTYGAFMVSVLPEEPDARTAVERLLREAAAMFCAPQSASVQQSLRSFRASTVRALEDKIGAAKKTRRLPARVDARALALFYSAVLQGMSAQARDGATRTELDAIVDTALLAWPSSRA